MQHPEINTCSLGPWWGKEEQTTNVPLMIGTMVSHNSRIPASEENPISCVQANMETCPFHWMASTPEVSPISG